MSSGSMMSNVGNSQIHADGDQKTSKTNASDDTERFEKGADAHKLLDSNDNMTLGNRLEKATKEEEKEEKDSAPVDPRKPAQDHGNKPSRGAEIDAELMADDQKRMEEKGLA